MENKQSGRWEEAAPLRMTCEYGSCNRHIGKDYKRNETKGWWSKEPIFLCDDHAAEMKLTELFTDKI